MATRFRLPASGAPDVSPALQSYTHNAPATVRTKLITSDSTALATAAYAPDGADHIAAGDALLRQFVSDPMAAGNVFTSGDTLKFCVQCLEDHTNNNLNVQVFVGVVNQPGETAQATIRSKVEPNATELATTLTSRFCSTTLSGSYTTVLGDRLVVELATEGTPVATSGVQGHNAQMRFGSNGGGGDLAENDTQTGTTLNPWIEFATTITFQAINEADYDAVGRGVLSGVGRGVA